MDPARPKAVERRLARRRSQDRSNLYNRRLWHAGPPDRVKPCQPTGRSGNGSAAIEVFFQGCREWLFLQGGEPAARRPASIEPACPSYGGGAGSSVALSRRTRGKDDGRRGQTDAP